MASFTKLKSGKWRAQVRKDGVYTSKTFTTKTAAKTWAQRTEVAIETGDYQTAQVQLPTLGKLLDRYETEFTARKKSNKAERSRLRTGEYPPDSPYRPVGCCLPEGQTRRHSPFDFFGALRLQGRLNPLPLHLACFRTYASTVPLPLRLQGSIPGTWLALTRAGVSPARMCGIAKPLLTPISPQSTWRYKARLWPG
ncbi:hypothetical protein [Sedimenticola hydrogenitrophicus]|uniref:hypothetical protein n=1 Tax=Sedimenticola hydrogenitrophicus TaxID=2967975 RepID=UPI0023B1F0AC|nr:hypothetical protein [Sedimenticola hydrogenitrophicus]